MKFLIGLATGTVLGVVAFLSGWNTEMFDSDSGIITRISDLSISEILSEPAEEGLALAQQSEQDLVFPRSVATSESVADVVDMAEPAPVHKQDVEPQNLVNEPISFTQIAWTRFRSERSASGFADTLSRQLGREFRVHKAKAGVYEVVFDYVNNDDLVQTLDSITALTGYTFTDSAVLR